MASVAARRLQSSEKENLTNFKVEGVEVLCTCTTIQCYLVDRESDREQIPRQSQTFTQTYPLSHYDRHWSKFQ